MKEAADWSAAHKRLDLSRKRRLLRLFGSCFSLGYPGLPVREARIVAASAPLLAVSDASPRCFAHWARSASIPNPLGDVVPKLPGNSHSRVILTLLAIPDVPPACFAHWARQAPVPSSLRGGLKGFIRRPRPAAADRRSHPLPLRSSALPQRSCPSSPREPARRSQRQSPDSP